jgi:16S rRNA (guanine(966)-N(2))-methyltransferase RsmD
VRIIGGRYRRTPIAVVAAPGLRPTPDRVRETLFNWVDHLLGNPAGLCVLDLFAGSGALGFEMASRGAQRVVLVDNNVQAVAALQALQARLGAAGIEIVRSDWEAAVARLAPASFDLVFLDPPFGSGLLPRALAAARRVVKPNGLIYAEAGAGTGAGISTATGAAAGPGGPADGAGLEVVRCGKAGAVVFQLLRTPGS